MQLANCRYWLLAGSAILLAATSTHPVTAQAQTVISQPQKDVRPLPGGLNNSLVFNSNSPEVVKTSGILLSTFPSQEMQDKSAHLNMPLKGQVDFFLHHINNAVAETTPKTLYLALLLENPGNRQVRVKIKQAASYLSQPDAPFIALPDIVDNAAADVYAGPGDRVTNDFLRGTKQAGWPAEIRLKPKERKLLFNLPIPVSQLSPPINGRSTLIRSEIDGSVYAASLAMFSDNAAAPTLKDWELLLQSGSLCAARERPPTAPHTTTSIVYGRVAGIARGNLWKSILCDCACSHCKLKLPPPGESLSYVISGLENGSFGTEQIQSAPLMMRYPDTAYLANGNYAVKYDLLLPLHNDSAEKQVVSLSLQTPLKSDERLPSLNFYQDPPSRIFYRGQLRISYTDGNGRRQEKYVHLVESRGQRGQPLLVLNMLPGQTRQVQVEFLYPPDATPPQVLTISTAALSPTK